jgi:hypothetical protein
MAMTRLRNEQAGLFMSYRMAMGGGEKVGGSVPPIITTIRKFGKTNLQTVIPVTVVMQRFRWAHTIKQTARPVAIEP